MKEKTPLEEVKSSIERILGYPEEEIGFHLSALFEQFDTSISGYDVPLLEKEKRYLLNVYKLGKECGKSDALNHAREFNEYDLIDFEIEARKLNHLRPLNSCYVACPQDVVDAGKCECMNTYRNAPPY